MNVIPAPRRRLVPVRPRHRRRAVGPATALAAWLVAWSSGVAAYDLADHRWRDRLLLVFAADVAAVDAAGLRPALAAATTAVAERDLVVFELYHHGTGRRGERSLTAGEAAAIRRTLVVSRDFTGMVLVGKDGTEKLRAPLDYPLEGVFRRIDAMPMRRAEMRAAGQAGEGN